MKNIRSNKLQTAFTLIELITVIAIIAILMSLLLPALSSSQENARRGKASTVLKAIVHAAKAYATDYGRFPPIEDAEDGDDKNGTYSYGDKEAGLCKVENDQLFDVLRAIPLEPNEDHKLNKRQQKYFEQEKATDPKNPREGFCDGKDFSDDKKGQLMDPWGKQYCIVLDRDGDEVIDMSPFYTDLSGPENYLRVSAATFAMAKDGKRGGKGYEGQYKKDKSNEAPDDLVSW